MSFVFDDFVLDCDRRELRRGAALVQVEPKVLDFLAYLVRNRHRVVSKDELIDAVWMSRIVSDSALATCISSARAALADRGGKPRLIKTLPRKGLRFIGAVQEDERSPTSNAGQFPPELPSIAVLPFQNISDDPDQECLCDGLVEDVISGLARIKWLFVVARNSSFVYKGNSVDVRRVGRELGVRYVLEGSVRKDGHRVRVSSQLIEAESGLHIWAQRYDRVWNDIFALQDELSMNVVGAIEPRLRAVEIERVRRKRPESLQAYDLVMRALPFSYRHTTADAAKAIPLLQKAIELEPTYSAAYAYLAWCYQGRFRYGLREEDRTAAIQYARAAIAQSSDDATVLAIAGFIVALNERDYATGFTMFDRALAASPWNIFALSCSALILAFRAQPGAAIERAERALRVSPLDPLHYIAYNALAVSNFTMGRYEASRDAARLSVQLNPQYAVCHLFLTAALVRLGDEAEAKRGAQRVLTLNPSFTIRRLAARLGLDPLVLEPLADAWGKVSLPEE